MYRIIGQLNLTQEIFGSSWQPIVMHPEKWNKNEMETRWTCNVINNIKVAPSLAGTTDLQTFLFLQWVLLRHCQTWFNPACTMRTSVHKARTEALSHYAHLLCRTTTYLSQNQLKMCNSINIIYPCSVLMAILIGEPGLAGCPLNSPPFIPELHIPK